MAQVLYVKTTERDAATGKQNAREEKKLVARSWSDSKGSQIYLHLNGTYGYKDGNPIRDVREFDVIGDVIQRDRAIAWWNLKGQRVSEDFYSKKRIELEKRAADPDEIINKVTDLDTAQYVRRPKNNRSNRAFCEPNTWVGYGFHERPPWWGLLEIAEDKSWHYRLINPEMLDKEIPPDEDQGEAALG